MVRPACCAPQHLLFPTCRAFDAKCSDEIWEAEVSSLGTSPVGTILGAFPSLPVSPSFSAHIRAFSRVCLPFEHSPQGYSPLHTSSEHVLPLRTVYRVLRPGWWGKHAICPQHNYPGCASSSVLFLQGVLPPALALGPCPSSRVIPGLTRSPLATLRDIAPYGTVLRAPLVASAHPLLASPCLTAVISMVI